MTELRPGDLAYLRAVPRLVHEAGVFGLDHEVTALVTALITDGHVLLEGNPGLGKTALVKALAGALGLGTDPEDGRPAVGRIQFTPDLMPSDITGTLMPEPGGTLEFRPGPVFHKLLIADEINRATPKTQAAMLEAMAENQVTVLGRTHDLRRPRQVLLDGALQAVRPPFMVMATQNPIDQEGTHDLPEAQSDRFMFKLRMRMPGSGVLAAILAKELAPPRQAPGAPSPAFAGALQAASVPGGPVAGGAVPAGAVQGGWGAIGQGGGGPATGAGPRPGAAGDPAALARLYRAAMAVRSQRLPADVMAHAINIVQATNLHFDQLVALSSRRRQALEAHCQGRVTYPLGPRAAAALGKAALGWMAADPRGPEDPDLVLQLALRGLAATVVPALRHRVKLDLFAAGAEAEAEILDAWLRDLARLAAPDLAVTAQALGIGATPHLVAGDSLAGYDARFAGEMDAAAGIRL